MTVEEARKKMGKAADKYSDKQLSEVIRTLTVLADLAIDEALNKQKERKIKEYKYNPDAQN